MHIPYQFLIFAKTNTVQQYVQRLVITIAYIASSMLSHSVEEKLVLTILELAAQLSRRGDVISEQVGITTQQWIIMLYIYGDPNIPFIARQYAEGAFSHNTGQLASDIAEALNVSRPNITNILNSLMAKGLVTQEKDPRDKRRKVLRVTEVGIRLLETIEPYRRHANLALFSRLSLSEKKRILNNLRFLLSRLNHD